MIQISGGLYAFELVRPPPESCCGVRRVVESEKCCETVLD